VVIDDNGLRADRLRLDRESGDKDRLDDMGAT
jgi:hypothetical protein